MTPPAAAPLDVMGVGVAALDYLTQIESWPGPDVKLKTDSLLITGGGTVGTALVALARLGLKAAFGGSVGDDDAGRRVMEEFVRESVDTSATTVAAGARTPWAFCVAHGSSRNVFSVRGTAPPLQLEDTRIEALLACRALHLDGSEEQASCRLAREARKRGVLVSLDGGSVRDSTHELIPHVDLLVMSEPFLKQLAGAEAGGRDLVGLHRPGRMLTAVTRGAGGTLAYDGRDLFELPAERVEVVDTTGAGDVFHGALLAGILEGMALVRALELATHVAARSCTALGGRQAIPQRSELASGVLDER